MLVRAISAPPKRPKRRFLIPRAPHAASGTAIAFFIGLERNPLLSCAAILSATKLRVNIGVKTPDIQRDGFR